MMYRLLIADDEKAISQGLTNYFPWEQVGFKAVGSVLNGKRALEFMHAHQVDVLLSDIRMPIMDGIEMVKRMREQGSQVKVVFLSAYRDFEYAQSAMQYGVSGYIVKPTKHEELRVVFERLRQALDAEQALQELPGGDVQAELEFATIAQVVKQYVRRNLCCASLESAARHVSMNPQYLSKMFKKKTGENFSEYLRRTRMEEAKRLLGDARVRVGEVSAIVGYSDGKNFTRAFQCHFGLTPREYRESLERRAEQHEKE